MTSSRYISDVTFFLSFTFMLLCLCGKWKVKSSINQNLSVMLKEVKSKVNTGIVV